MKTIGTANGIGIAIPDDASLSFHNSPYIGHRNQSSVDIYPAHEDWSGSAFSPVDGKVVRTQQIKMGKPRRFKTEEFDHAIGIQPIDNEESIVRILHCKPTIQIGDTISAGEEIGSLLRSRYFNFWTSPHYHVEVLNSQDFRRSSNSYVIEKAAEFLEEPITYDGDTILDASWRIESVTADYAIATSDSSAFGKLGDIYGHLAEIETRHSGLIDAGLPHYPHGGVFGLTLESGSVSIGNRIIGELTLPSYFERKCRYVMYLNDIQIRGVSMYLYSKQKLISNRPPLKIIPREYNGFDRVIGEGEAFTLSLRPLE